MNGPDLSKQLENLSMLQVFKEQRNEVRVELKDAFNRLHSIAHDAEFVETVKSTFSFPVVANQRCGAWYVRPEDDIYAYFKSTDGHIGVHKFSMRRANLALLPVILENTGIVIVDSTRRGKRFPDSLSKTIPIWAATLNRARSILRSRRGESPDDGAWNENAKLWTLPTTVGRSEHSQIEAKIEGWAQTLADSTYDLSGLLALDRPIRPIFISPASTLLGGGASGERDFYPIVCVSASKLVGVDEIGRAFGFVYVPGAGDDAEAWSKGLTPDLFWRNYEILLAATRSEINDSIQDIVRTHRLSPKDSPVDSSAPLSDSFRQIRATRIFVDFNGSTPTTSTSSRTVVIESGTTTSTTPSSLDALERTLTIKPKIGKAGQVAFFAQLPSVLDFLVPPLRQEGNDVMVVVANCSDPLGQSGANDLGLALALILLVKTYDDSGVALAEEEELKITKSTIRTRLMWILEAFPAVNPSRSILIAVNTFLMSMHRRNITSTAKK